MQYQQVKDLIQRENCGKVKTGREDTMRKNSYKQP
jgi:hypothetical protein